MRQSTAACSAIPDSDGGDHSSQSFSLPWQSLWEIIFNSHVRLVMCKGGPLAIAATTFHTTSDFQVVVSTLLGRLCVCVCVCVDHDTFICIHSIERCADREPTRHLCIPVCCQL